MAEIFGRSRRRVAVAGVLAALLVVVLVGAVALSGSLGSGSSPAPGATGSAVIANASMSSGASPSASVSAGTADASASPGETASSAAPSAGETSTASAGETATAGASAAGVTTAPATATPTHAPTVTPTPALPDLAFHGVTIYTIRCGQEFPVVVEVENRGSATAHAPIPIRLTDTYSGHQVIYDVVTIDFDMAPGGSRTITFHDSTNQGCNLNHILTVKIDPDNTITEVTKANNTQTLTYHLQPMPDLSDTWVATNVDPTCGVQFTVTTIVHNQGGLVMPQAAHVRFTDSYGGVAQRSNFETLPIIASGGNTTIHTHMTINTHCGQPHRMTVMVDSGYEIAESNEDNNTRYIDYRM